MGEKPDLDQLSIAIGNPSRMSMLALLMEGRALTAKELAYGSGIEPGAATGHLHQLVSAGLIHYVNQGRFKYFQLATPEVAMLIETMMTLAPHKKVKRKLPAKELCDARYCYDHLAGKLGTQIYNFLIDNNLLESDCRNLRLTPQGKECFEKMGIDVKSFEQGQRKNAYQCLDWSERTFHIGGALGHTLATFFADDKWICRRKNSRVVDVTERGKLLFEKHFAFKLE